MPVSKIIKTQSWPVPHTSVDYDQQPAPSLSIPGWQVDNSDSAAPQPAPFLPAATTRVCDLTTSPISGDGSSFLLVSQAKILGVFLYSLFSLTPHLLVLVSPYSEAGRWVSPDTGSCPVEQHVWVKEQVAHKPIEMQGYSAAGMSRHRRKKRSQQICRPSDLSLECASQGLGCHTRDPRTRSRQNPSYHKWSLKVLRNWGKFAYQKWHPDKAGLYLSSHCRGCVLRLHVQRRSRDPSLETPRDARWKPSWPDIFLTRLPWGLISEILQTRRTSS